MYLGSRADSMPASTIPNRVRAEAPASATPASTDTSRLRPANRVPTPPAKVRALASRSLGALSPEVISSSRPSRPRWGSSRCTAMRSLATPMRARRRAGPAWATGDRIIWMPPEASAAEPTKMNGSCRRLSCHKGVAVSDSSTAV